jgi:hypothetical protein
MPAHRHYAGEPLSSGPRLVVVRRAAVGGRGAEQFADLGPGEFLVVDVVDGLVQACWARTMRYPVRSPGRHRLIGNSHTVR